MNSKDNLNPNSSSEIEQIRQVIHPSIQTSTCPSRGASPDAAPHCLICLESLEKKSRALLPNCKHSLYCLECIIQWTSTPIQPTTSRNQSSIASGNQLPDTERDRDGNRLINSRTCPLCKEPIGSFIFYDVISNQDYRKHWLRPPITIQDKLQSTRRDDSNRINGFNRPHVVSRQGDTTDWGPNEDSLQRRRRLQERRWEKGLEFRRQVYQRGLFALHLGTNHHSKQRSIPTPETFSTSIQEQRRACNFIRREFWSWPSDGLDTEWLTNYTLAILKEIPLRSDSTIRLLSDFLGPKGSEHFVHELYCFLRSPFGYEEGGKGLERYDDFVGYRLEEPQIETRRSHDRIEEDTRGVSSSAGSSRASKGKERERERRSLEGDDSRGVSKDDRRSSPSRSQVDSREKVKEKRMSRSSAKIRSRSRSISPIRSRENHSSSTASSSKDFTLNIPAPNLNESNTSEEKQREQVINLREKLLSRLEEERNLLKRNLEQAEVAAAEDVGEGSKGKEKEVNTSVDESGSFSKGERDQDCLTEGVGTSSAGYLDENLGETSQGLDSDGLKNTSTSREKLLAKLLLERRKLRENEKS